MSGATAKARCTFSAIVKEFTRKLSSPNLFTLARHLDLAPDNDGRFCSCKVICGLQCRHAKRIVQTHDFRTTPQFMELEIANGTEITAKTGVWSVALLVAHVTSKVVRLNVSRESDVIQWASSGRYRISNVENSRSHLKLLSSPVSYNYKKLSDITGVKNLDFYRGVD
ncbi:hypothetical protein TSMEX_004950 [Taenia solium]|eukprot:TsM_000373400 transcript=TsM_000373400 gene=TsM_000373400